MTDRARAFERLQRGLTTLVRRTAIPRAHERVIARAGVDIERVEAVALGRICDVGPMTVSELADQLGVACSTAGRHAAHLERAGLVRRAPAQGDRRVTVLTARDGGREVVHRLREAHCSLLAETLSGWETEDLCALTDLLERMGRDTVSLGQRAEIEA